MSERCVQRGVFIELVTEDVVMPNGKRVRLDVIRHPGASAIVPFLDDGRILLIRQFRHAAGGTILEVPAGKLDRGESPAQCALRELEEETGWRAGRLEALGSILTTPGFTDECIHLFAAFELEAGVQRLEEDELLELVPTPLDEALQLVLGDGLRDAKSAVAILRAAAHLGRLPGGDPKPIAP